MTVRVVVVNSQTTAQVDVTDDQPCTLEPLHYVIDLLALKTDNLFDLHYLGAYVELQSEEIDKRVVLDHGHCFVETAVGDTELVLIKSGSYIMMGVRIYVRIDPEAHRSPASQPSGNIADDLYLFKGFHHKCSYPHLEGLTDLFV